MDKRDSQQIIFLTPPVNLAAAATTCDWFSMKNFNHARIVIMKAVGTSGEVPTFTLLQGTDVSGAGSKALNFTKVVTKVNATYSSELLPTLVTQASGNTYAPATGATTVLAIIDIDASNLDVQNGFDCVSMTINDVGTDAQWACVIAILDECRYDAMTAPSLGN